MVEGGAFGGGDVEAESGGHGEVSGDLLSVSDALETSYSFLC
jgi:hypothetical protein